MRVLVCPGAAAVALLVVQPPLGAENLRRAVPGDRVAIEHHGGAVGGSARIVGMSGAVLASGHGSATALLNPAALAIRPGAERGAWGWDAHFYLVSSFDGDLDNDGRRDGVGAIPTLSMGASLAYRECALGLSEAVAHTPRMVRDGEEAYAGQSELRLSVGCTLLSRQLAVGVSLGVALLSIEVDEKNLFTGYSTLAGAGAILSPAGQDYRIGATVRGPVHHSSDPPGCDPSDCNGWVLPSTSQVPWSAAAGLAWRFADASWNREVSGAFRDERYLLVEADLTIIGAVDDGFGISAFRRQRLQPSDRSTSLSPRLGADLEIVPGYLRVRGGSYWEPARLQSDDADHLSGRLHATIGMDMRLFSFRLWKPFRVMLSFAGDLARDYTQSGFSLGFWE